jgi:heme-binding protein
MFSARRGLGGLRTAAVGLTMFLGAFLGVFFGTLLGTAATAAADPPQPNCTSADLAGVLSGVTAATSVYLFTHPDVNAYFTSLKDLPVDQRREQIRAYLDTNPQVKADLQGIRQPSLDFRARCAVA